MFGLVPQRDSNYFIRNKHVLVVVAKMMLLLNEGQIWDLFSEIAVLF